MVSVKAKLIQKAKPLQNNNEQVNQGHHFKVFGDKINWIKFDISKAMPFLIEHTLFSISKIFKGLIRGPEEIISKEWRM